MEDLRTYLNNVRTSSVRHFSVETAFARTDLDKATVQTVFSVLVQEDALKAKIEVRCPHCTAQQGIFTKRSEVPSRSKICIDCEREFRVDKKRNWEVVYEIVDGDHDFFPEDGQWQIRKFIDEEVDCSKSFFEQELKRFEKMDNPQKRGRDFDYFVGLLFQQLEGVDIRIKPNGNSGEVDVHMSCLDAQDWLYRLVGSNTFIENKWVSPPIEKSEIIDFYEKVEDLPNCRRAYFLSMSGFTKGQRTKTGALAKVRAYKDPILVDLYRDDLDQMIENASPESTLRNRQMY